MGNVNVNQANESDDMGYNKPYEPVEHDYLGYTIKELETRDTQWDCKDSSGRLTYKPSQRQYNIIRPDGTHIRAGHTIAPVVVTRYGAALKLIHADRDEEKALLEELVTGPTATVRPEYEDVSEH